MYNSAGVEIYAFKPDYLLREGNSDENINYAMQAGKLLGASHVTLELPKEASHSLKLGQLGEKNGMKVAYHGHEQQHPHWWDTALEQSPNNAMNLDLGHYIAAGNTDPFYQAKLQTARFYFTKLLPETASLMQTARADTDVLMDTDAALA